MEKDYGKLTKDQLRRFVRQLPEFRKEYAGFEEVIRGATPEKLREVLGDGIWWAPLYELPFNMGLALLFYVLRESERNKELSLMPDPQEVLLREMEGKKKLEWDGGPNKAFDVVGARHISGERAEGVRNCPTKTEVGQVYDGLFSPLLEPPVSAWRL